VAAVDPDRHEVDRPQDAEVLRDLRLRQPEPVDEVADRRLPGPEGVEQPATAGIGDGVERIGRRRSARC
jgi:hypothetical protein